MPLPAIGILVGGSARRMGGVPKSNLTLEGRSVLERTLDACRTAAERVDRCAAASIYLVGESAAYTAEDVLRLDDRPAGIGPMGGLRALLLAAQRHGVPAVALAGDQPFLTADLLERLYREGEGALALAPRDESGRWQPLFARYAPEPVLREVEAALALGQTSLQMVFRRLGAHAAELELSASEWQALRDWDRPSDMLQTTR